jgi:predicted  nucleic acid-binding Zn-ribbon protein
LALNALNSGQLLMKLRVSNTMFCNHLNCCLTILSWSDTLLKHEASLGNALLRVKGLDAKLKANTKALEEAQTHLAASEAKHKEEVVAAKQGASHAIKEAEARASTMEDALAKIGQEQSKHEETAAKRLNPLSTSFGSNCFLPLRLCFSLCINVPDIS